MQWRGINDEHSEARPSNDTCEVVIIGNDLTAEWECESCFDSIDVEALHDEDGQVDNGLRFRKCVDLALCVDRPPLIVDEVRTILLEVP